MLADSISIPQCSRAGCQQSATWRVNWRNPKIHDEQRQKTWLACDEHVNYLHDFLVARSFPVALVAFVAPRRTERG